MASWQDVLVAVRQGWLHLSVRRVCTFVSRNYLAVVPLSVNFNEDFRLRNWLAHEQRTLIVNAWVRFAPHRLQRWSERIFDVPIPKNVREQASGLLFIHIPKNAGSTICEQLYGRHTGHRTAEWYKIADPKFFESQLSFAIVRDPLARFISAYHFVRNGGSALVPASQRARQAVAGFSSLMDFATFFASQPVEALERIDPCFHRQSRYVMIDGQQAVSKIFRLEEVTGKILRLNGYNVDLRVFRNKSQTEEVKDGCENTELKKLVERLYVEDYQILESCAERSV